MDQVCTVFGEMSSFQKFDKLTKRDQVADVAKNFEAILFRKFLGDAMKPMFKTMLKSEGSSSDVYRYLFIDSIAQAVAATSPLNMDKIISQDKSVAETIKDNQT